MAVGAPAIITALLLDTLLYNEFLISTGEPVMWGFIAAFLYVEAAIVVAVARRVLRRLRT